jgi:lysine-N-methylase
MPAPHDKNLVLASELAAGFRCVGPECKDTCCAGWIIEVDATTQRKYQRKYDLKDVSERYDDTRYAMRCDKPAGTCTENHKGWCGIQQKYGEEYLSDTCYFFPRSFRQLGKERFMGASLSCPEVARRALFETHMFSRISIPVQRELDISHNHLPEDMEQQAALLFHKRLFEQLQNPSYSAEQHIMWLIDLCDALENHPYDTWLTRLDSKPLTSQDLPPSDTYDALRVLHNLLNIAIADNSQYRERLYQTIRDIEKALNAPLHWQEATLDYTNESLRTALAVQQDWKNHSGSFAQILHNWLLAYASNKIFPFGGLGHNPQEEIFLLTVHFVTMKLAIMCACYREKRAIEAPEVVRITQSIARLYDHITDAQIFFNAYDHKPWQHPDGLKALLSW